LNNSLEYLGSQELYEKIIEDLNSIIYYAVASKFIPIQLVVGRIFVEMSCCHSLIADLDIKDWSYVCNHRRDDISQLISERILEVLKDLEKKDGKLGDKEFLEIYYSPDESYISLYAADTTKRAEPGELSTADGFAILRFRYKINNLESEENH